MKKILYLAAVCISLLSCTEDKLPSGMAFGIPPGKAGGDPMITVQPTAITLGSDGMAQTIKISSNTSWTVRAGDSWLNYSPTGGTGGSNITVSATKNTGEERSTRLIFSDKTGMVTASVLVTQEKAAAEKEEISVNKTSLTFSAEGGSESVEVSSNFAWETISKPSWITLSPTSGKSGNTSLTITAVKNSSTTEQTGTITLGKNSSATVSISVKQDPATPKNDLTASPTSLVFTKYNGETLKMSITSSLAWQTASKPTWISLSPSNGSKGTTEVSVYTLDDLHTIHVDGQSFYNGTIIIRDSLENEISISVSRPKKSSGSSSETITVNGVSFKMIKVDGGTFTMGATEEQGDDASDDEKPAHSVTLSDFYIGETEVTNALWYAIEGKRTGSLTEVNIEDDYPVHNVSYLDCIDFCEKLKTLTGETFRLPTEAEWEYAASGGQESKNYLYSGSNDVDEVAWCWYQSSPMYDPEKVKGKKPNELGIYDMSGNIAEWCFDWYGNYSPESQTDPTGPTTGSNRILRGGCHAWEANSCRVTARAIGSNSRASNYGFRIVLEK